MTDANTRLHDVAVSLMRLALPLLDRAGDTLAAARLQHAIDTALDTPPMRENDELTFEFAAPVQRVRALP